MTTRKFYGFNDPEAVKNNIAQVKTLSDLMQLAYDIKASGINLTEFRTGVSGVYSVDCLADLPTSRHVFMTSEAFNRFGAPLPSEADSYTVLEDEATP